MDGQRGRDEEREDDEAFLDVWREWRQDRSRAACEAKIAWVRANRSPYAPAWRGAISSAGTVRRRCERRRVLPTDLPTSPPITLGGG